MLSSETLLFPTQQHKKQERPFSSLLKAAFFIGLSSYLFFLIPTSPAKPVPKRSMADGSGTDLAPS